MDVGPSVIGALATYFGERPIDVVLYDPDPEKLELFGRFAKVAFSFNKTPHDLALAAELEDALDEPWRTIVCVGDESADDMLQRAGRGADVCAIGRHAGGRGVACLDAPPPLDDEERRALPHQIMRWVRGEEYLYEFFREHENSPLKRWLDGTTLAEL